MADPTLITMSLLGVSTIGVKLVSSITKYLSTLSRPIDTIEELVAVCSVTSNLLVTLNANVNRFYPSPDTTPPFVQPLCHDIVAALSHFAQKMQKARAMKVFEPDSIGFVKLPRHAWAFVMGGEVPMGQFRNRLYVEKYRVRVLIDAVAWQGLRGIGVVGRTEEQEREVERLRKMLPLVADRLMGVLKDYQTRIQISDKGIRESSDCFQVGETAVKAVEAREVEFGTELERGNEGVKSTFEICNSSSTTSLASTCSSDSSTSTQVSSIWASAKDVADLHSLLSSKPRPLLVEPLVHERWVLREHTPTRTLTMSTTFCSVSVKKTYTHSPAHHYVKPLPSNQSEMEELLNSNFASESLVQKTILKMPDTAQWEIQRLLERRDEASSNDQVKRSFEIVAVTPQPRRKIHPKTTSVVSRFARLWSKSQREGPEEWVLLIRGKTIDRLPRTTPDKESNPWSPKPKVLAPPPQRVGWPTQSQLPQVKRAVTSLPGTSITQADETRHGGNMSRQVLQKRGMSVEEAEKRMEGIFSDLFVRAKGEEKKSEDRHIVGDGGKIEDGKNPFM